MKTNLYFVAGFYALPVRLRKGVGVPYHRAVEGRGGFVSTVTLYKALQTSWLWFWFAFLGGGGVRFEEHTSTCAHILSPTSRASNHIKLINM